LRFLLLRRPVYQRRCCSGAHCTAGLHRFPCLRAGFGDLGVDQRDLSESGARKRAGSGQFYSSGLVFLGVHDLSCSRCGAMVAGGQHDKS
jgi:hypothetical protein